jgi:CRP/FNR family transcriptional regulator
MSSISIETFQNVFPAFKNEREALLDRLLGAAVSKNFSCGAPLYFEGDRCAGIGFLLSGEIRVFKIGESGREITLYEIFPGETCILNASCLLSRQPYPAHATGTSDGTILFIPDQLFLRCMAESDAMRNFIFSLFSKRFNEIIELLEEVTFGKLKERLTDYLIEKSSNDLLPASHQTIANDLGTSREVISRLLKDFEKKGKVSLSRNQVKIIRI